MPRKFHKQAPYTPDESRRLIRAAGLFQRDLAKALGLTDTAIGAYLDNRSYSQRFWDYFHAHVVPLAKAS